MAVEVFLVVGEHFSVADLVCGAVLIFARSSSLTDGMPNINAYLERLDVLPTDVVNAADRGSVPE